MKASLCNLDEDLIEKVDKYKESICRIWEPIDTVVVLGRANKKEKEVHLERCSKENIAVIKRKTGGGAVVLTPGILVISIAKLVKNCLRILDYFDHINDIIIDCLVCHGVRNLTKKGTSDVCIEEKKILGSSIYSPVGSLFYQASLLVSCSLGTISKYLKHPSREPHYRKGRKHKDFLTTLQKEGYYIEIDILRKSLKKALDDNLWRIN